MINVKVKKIYFLFHKIGNSLKGQNTFLGLMVL